MTKNKKILIIGCGNMGSAIINQLLESDFVSKQALLVFDKSKKSHLSGIVMASDLQKAVAKSDIIILAIKPQQFELLAQELRGCLREDQLVISIMAGVTYQYISHALEHKKVVRTMPNLALQVGESITAYYAPFSISKNIKTQLVKMLASFGQVIEVKTEDMIDKVTAISGSGPAYFFYTTEILEKIARELGFSQKQASLLARQTLVGAAKLAQQDSRSSVELRQAVTSKGGTTEAALKKLGTGFVVMWRKAIKAAYQRAKIISKKYD